MMTKQKQPPAFEPFTPPLKEQVGIMTGTITCQGVVVEGTFEVAVYFKPGPPRQGEPRGYLIGYATRKE